MNCSVYDLSSFRVKLNPRKALEACELFHLRIYAINRLPVVQNRSRDHHLDRCE
jgi:hypothetical protein